MARTKLSKEKLKGKKYKKHQVKNKLKPWGAEFTNQMRKPGFRKWWKSWKSRDKYYQKRAPIFNKFNELKPLGEYYTTGLRKAMPHMKKKRGYDKLFTGSDAHLKSTWDNKDVSLRKYLALKGNRRDLARIRKEQIKKGTLTPERVRYLKAMNEHYKKKLSGYGWTRGKNYRTKGTLLRSYGKIKKRNGRIELLNIFSPGLYSPRYAMKGPKGFRFISGDTFNKLRKKVHKQRFKEGKLPVKKYGWKKQALKYSFNKHGIRKFHPIPKARPPSPVY